MDTPMMSQYKEIKSKYSDYIVFFRLGDFYEMFFEDAYICSKELDIALTSRDPQNKVPMAGVPYHTANQYISKLVSKGYKVVICEQVEDPKLAKGIVKREVVKIVTPGTITDLSALEDNKNNYLGCIIKQNDKFGLAFVDLMTGEFDITEIVSSYPFHEVINEVSRFEPRECLVTERLAKEKPFNKNLRENLKIYFTVKGEDFFEEEVFNLLISHFGKEKIANLDDKKLALKAAGASLKYLNETQKLNLSHINSISYYQNCDYMILDYTCRKNLEITESLRDGKKVGSLLWVLDKTSTAMGARLLRKWLERPLIDILRIKQRQDAVEELLSDFFLRSDIKELLKNTHDLERLTGKLVCGNANARDLLAIKTAIMKLPKIKQVLLKCDSKLLNHIYEQLDTLEDVYELLDKAISEDPPLTIKEGDIIKEGYNSEIDLLRKAAREGKAWIANLESKERERTGIKSLKIGFNKVFGYYIEVTKSNLAMVPEDYIRKQTLVNSERYITEQLKEYEELILNSKEKLQELEYNIFCKVRNQVIDEIPRLKHSAYYLAMLDVLVSLAEVAYKNNYVKPEIMLNDEINITDGRHPVVELTLKDELFIPNDTHINCKDSLISIITGPNMAGKSTYMRQVALIVIMAQIGSFVPAKKAQICIVDRIFTRIGAADNLAMGQSTFMVEMMEVANILNNATEKSLLILDEVGRGTSTFDGLSIAWAVLEFIQEKLKCKTLFATHYHELTALRNLKGIKNYKITVKEKDEDIIFLRKIVPGETDKSYGIQVAKLAGVPNSVINRAKKFLASLEQNKTDNKVALPEIAVTNDNAAKDNQLSLEHYKNQEIIEKIKALNIDTTTPLEALNFVHSIKRQLI
ncbi:DNA mismatch repair protein MutS [Tepidanaerobacter sp. GT38]|uniref:DNA mismatch repair protein MutS n=1 Tax=Tepidanaerobacter sp. GT38 TaxID=2722793 RepID=UPI001F027EF8|nr:DNA mismatch repair protein MutS [Tepidanaerobacter sp. GT38]MCG1011982.1 DNA mismatch repair protein MutS [Tepidanaerobacter sp. GT38]